MGKEKPRTYRTGPRYVFYKPPPIDLLTIDY